MLAGTPPFTGATPRAIMARHALDPVPPLRTARPGIPAQLEAALQRALAKVPADRFGSAADFVRALDSAAVMATVLSEARAPRRRPSRVGFVAMVAILSLVIGVLTLRSLVNRAPVKPPDPNLVAVAPFRVTAADPALAYLREGMLDLLAARLTGQGGPRASDPRAVLSAWRRAAGSDLTEVPQERAIWLAEGLGAGQLIVGNVVGAPGRVTLNATVLSVPDGRTRAEASVDGTTDSLPTLVDQLATRLLTLGAQEGEQRLTALTSTSLPALRLYLDGQALYRRGKYQQSTVLFGRALDLDSTFALAALGLLASSSRTGEYDPSRRALRLAGATRSRLNARDQAYLRVLEGGAYGDTTFYSDMLQRAEEFVAIAPDRVEAYVELGEILFTFGPTMIGIERAHERSAVAFRKALEMDSTYAPALDSPLVLAARAGDSATIRRVDRLYRAIDPVAGLRLPLRWRAAVALKDQGELERVRAAFDMASWENLSLIGQLSQYDGVSLEDADLAFHTSLKRESRGEYRNAVFVELATLALNRGRPTEALGFREQEATFRGNNWANMARVLDALYWDGDTVAASAAMRDLEFFVQRASRKDLKPRQQVDCVKEQWHLAHGRSSSVRASIAELRNVARADARWRMTSLGCAILLDAMLAAFEKRPEAEAALGRLDSLMQSGPPYRLYDQAWNLVVARLKEQRGDVSGALAATRRRLYLFAEPMYLSTYLREEGRLATLTGDRSGAIRAYRHYLTLRATPEPRLRPTVEQVRADLAQLESERGP